MCNIYPFPYCTEPLSTYELRQNPNTLCNKLLLVVGNYSPQWTCSVQGDGISLKYNQQDATFSRSIYFYKFLYMFQAVPPPIIRSTKLHTASGIVKPILRPAANVDEMERSLERSSISSTLASGSSIGLTIPDAVCTVLCSWWWAEERPETCRAIYRNK